MNVTLAGYNIDSSIIDELKKRTDWTEDNITPETLSAAYARISRDPADIGELRKISRTEVAKSRKSNETIIFGLGHSSVAEHAVFNFDITGISRLATEEVQKFRIVSFTEKSQRYITLDGDFIMPSEIAESGFADRFSEVIKMQNDAYFTLFEALKEDLFAKNAGKIKTKRDQIDLETKAKEDARYVVALATKTQFGMTVNARSLENMLRQFNSSDLAEVRELSAKLFEKVKSLAPSLIKYVEPTKHDAAIKAFKASEKPFIFDSLQVKKEASRQTGFALENSTAHSDFSPVSYSKDADTQLVAALLYTYSNQSFENCMEYARSIGFDEKKALIKQALASKESFEKVDKAFETIDYIFELTVSATNYAQLKRHRMTTQLVQDYDPSLGCTVPESVKEIGKEAFFNEIINKINDFYYDFAKVFPYSRNYILSNSHRRRVLLKINARELYHFISLRDDEHAQWDIRNTAREIAGFVKETNPLTSMLLCGKSRYGELFSKIFSEK
ncbi:FAD-dependent thymidylate synthase [bacterium]|nr:FAD-dependent thymidylate synthase [bacterium]